MKIQYYTKSDLNKSINFVMPLTQSKYKTQITRSVHCKFNCITVIYNGTQHGIYLGSSVTKVSTTKGITKPALFNIRCCQMSINIGYLHHSHLVISKRVLVLHLD